MGKLSNVIDIVKALLSGEQTIKDNKLKVFSGDKTDNSVTNNFNIQNLQINLGSLNEAERNKFASLLRTAPQGTANLTEESSEVLDFSKKVLQGKEELSIVEYFKGILDRDDIAILKSALVVKALHEKSLQVQDQISRLSERYGRRASTVCNLVTADYFNTYIIPLHKELSKSSGYTDESFREKYSQLIEHFPIAIFVNRHYTPAQLLKEIKERIESNKQFRIKSLHIHGIGPNNVDTIIKAISNLKKGKDYERYSISNEESSSVIVATLILDLSGENTR